MASVRRAGAENAGPGETEKPLGGGHNWVILHRQTRPFSVDIPVGRRLYTRSGALSA
jgi:hypothetical protein